MRSERIAAGLKWIAFAAVFLAILAFRRPDQFTHPYTWVEEGRDFIPQFLRHGWGVVLVPTAGYLIVPSKLIFAIAISLSFSHFPAIAFWLTVAFELAVCVAVAKAPTYLRLRFLCAAALMLIPINAEVYGVSEYAFWFGSILLFLSLLWREDVLDKSRWRYTFTVVGGLSSPVTIALTPLFLLRAYRFRSREEFRVAAIATLSALVQGACLYFTSPPPLPGTPETVITGGAVLAKFVGWYAYFDGVDGVGLGAWMGAAILSLLCYAFVRSREIGFAGLIALLSIAIAASLARAPLQWVSAYTDGPRYFFYPYLFLSWALIYAMAVAPRWCQALFAVLLLAGLRQTYLYGHRSHEPLDWAGEVATCLQSPSYNLRVHYAGQTDHLWHVTLTDGQCRRLVRRSLTRT